MSADNFYLIRKSGRKYAVDMGFASDDVPPEFDYQTMFFRSLRAAINYAQAQDSEYGLYFDLEEDDA